MMYFLAVIVVLVVLAAIYIVRFHRGNRPTDPVADIVFHSPAQPPVVSLGPDAVSDAELARMTLCYLAKVRWTVEKQSDELRTTFRAMLDCALLELNLDHGKEDMILDCPEFASVWQSIVIAGPSEVYTVRFFDNAPGRGAIVSSIARPGYAANTVLSALALINAVLDRSSLENRDQLLAALRLLWKNHLSGPYVDKSIRGLRGMMIAADTSWFEVLGDAG